jgi:hypothetical protein
MGAIAKSRAAGNSLRAILDKQEATAAEDAEEIFSAMVSSPYIDTGAEGLAALNSLILERANFFSLCELIRISNENDARNKAWRQHAPRRAAFEWVIAEWVAHSAAYEGNKSAFARDYSRRVKLEHGISITEKQMREVWLRDTPSASTPAG